MFAEDLSQVLSPNPSEIDETEIQIYHEAHCQLDEEVSSSEVLNEINLPILIKLLVMI